jgi:hypothetical protein
MPYQKRSIFNFVKRQFLSFCLASAGLLLENPAAAQLSGTLYMPQVDIGQTYSFTVAVIGPAQPPPLNTTTISASISGSPDFSIVNLCSNPQVAPCSILGFYTPTTTLPETAQAEVVLTHTYTPPPPGVASVAMIQSFILLSANGAAPTPTPSPEPIPSPTPSKFQITKTVNDFTIKPSVYAHKYSDGSSICGGITADSPSNKKINLTCVDLNTGQPTDGCSVLVSASLGSNSGGHDHTNSRPLGKIQDIELIVGQTTSTTVNISMPTNTNGAGSVIVYEAPEAAGDVNLNFDGYGPDGSPITVAPSVANVQVSEFSAIVADKLNFNIESHSSGNRGTTEMNNRIQQMTSWYVQYATDANLTSSQIPDLRSEAASVPRGGIFDIDQDWLTPHCGHRNGRQMDLSMSVFNNDPHAAILKDALERAIRKANLNFPYASESPNTGPGNNPADHWHVQY